MTFVSSYATTILDLYYVITKAMTQNPDLVQITRENEERVMEIFSLDTGC